MIEGLQCDDQKQTSMLKQKQFDKSFGCRPNLCCSA